MIIVATGCNKSKFLKTEYVEGIVRLDGEIVPEGTEVMFSPVVEGKGMPAIGRTDKSGLYTLSSTDGVPGKGAVEGDYKITVKYYEVTEYEEGDPRAPRDSYGNAQLSTSKLVTPPVYSQIMRTPLTYTVVKGKQTHDLDLVSKP